MSAMPTSDLDDVVQRLGQKWQSLRNADILVTGGTGFFGVWLVSTLLYADRVHGLGLRVHVAARHPEVFIQRAPEFRDAPGLRFIAADTRALALDETTRITHIIHAATSASVRLNESDPVEMAHIAAEGTRRVLVLAKEKGVSRMLFTSSGAVYGKLPPDITHVREDQMGLIDPLVTRNAYNEGKRLAELYCAAYSEKHQLEVVIARCFAFVGPYLPLDTHFAVGNFMRDAMRGQPIIVRGDGTPHRSYLYASDLVWWLLTLLLSGESGRAYNVGSEQSVSVRELANLIGEQRGVPVSVLGTPDPGRPVERYVPSAERICRELSVSVSVDLAESVRRTMSWYERVGGY